MMLLLVAFLSQSAPAASPTDVDVAPKLLNEGKVVLLSDYPAEAIRKDHSGIVSYVASVSNDGSVAACHITESSGYAELDAATCNAVRKRARFQPARDSSGTSTAGQYRSVTAYGVGRTFPTHDLAISLAVRSLPPTYKSAVRTRIVTNADGQVEACEIKETSGSDPADRAACSFLKGKMIIPPLKTANLDVPPAAVRNVKVSLQVKP